ncbi:MAG: lipid A biosynthesis acyltransferase [Myxococcaceae bacterium]|nr:lipid A biosynthesis acyltransferase [Myxococcaceae bacterium]
MAAPKPAITPGGPLATALVSLVVGLVRLLPRKVREALARALGSAVYTLGVRRRVALDNLAHAFPEKSDAERRAIARAAYRHLAQAAVEAVTSDLIPDAELKQAYAVLDWKGLDQRLGREGVMVVSAHFGSWELFAEVMGRGVIPFSAVVRPLAGAFNAHVVKLRQRSGVELILQRGALRGMLTALERKRPVVQLLDQSVPAKQGVFVPFFGRPASTSPASAAAALRAGVPIYVVLAAREDDRLVMEVEGPITREPSGDFRADVQALTAEVTAVLEQHIRKRPEQWLWLHRRWKEKPIA